MGTHTDYWSIPNFILIPEYISCESKLTIGLDPHFILQSGYMYEFILTIGLFLSSSHYLGTYMCESILTIGS